MPIILNKTPLDTSDPDLILWLSENSGKGNTWKDRTRFFNSATIFGPGATFNGGLITDGTSTNGNTIKNYAIGTLKQTPVNDFTFTVTFQIFGRNETAQPAQTIFSTPRDLSSNTAINLSYWDDDQFVFQQKKLVFGLSGTQNWYIFSNQTFEYNQRLNVTVTYSLSLKKIRMFVNGLEISILANGINPNDLTLPFSGQPFSQNYIISSFSNASGLSRPVNGVVYNVAIFKRTLSPAEVYALYQNKLFTISTKKASSDIILYLSDRGTSTGWADNSIYSTGARILGNATFSGGLITSGQATLDGAEGKFSTLPGENFTISALVCMYGPNSTTTNTILGTSPTSYLGSGVTRGRGFIFALTNSKQLYFLSDNAGGVLTTNNLFAFGETFLATVVVTNPSGTQQVSFYKNGKLVSTHSNPFSPVTMTYNDPTYRVNTWGFPSFTHQLNGKVVNLIVYNRPLSSSEILDLYLRMPPAYKSNESTLNQAPQGGKLLHIDAGNPKSYYLTGTTANDLSAYGRHGTFSSFGSSGLPTFGRMNGGYFSFKNGSFIGFNPQGLPTTGESTIIVWVRLTQFFNQIQTIFIYGGSGTLQSRSIVISANRAISITLDKYTGVSTSNNVAQLNEWIQIVQVNKSNNTSNPSLILYLNGRLISSMVSSRLTVATKARLGRNDVWLTLDNFNTYEFPFYGDVGELIIYDRALDPQEVYQDYKVKRSRYGLPEVTRLPGDVIPSSPTVTTLPVTNITTTSALSGVLINNDGYSTIYNYGIIWSTNQASLQPNANPTNLSTKTIDGSGVITGLSPNTNYYVVAYAQNSLGIGYGQILPFTTISIVLPVVQNVRGTSLTSKRIRATASVFSLGNDSNISERGFAYHTASFSEATGGTYPRVLETGFFGLATYSLDINGLSGNTNYWIRAFAKNTAGTDYSNDILQIITPPIPTVTIIESSIVTTQDSFTIPISTTGTSRVQQGIVYKLTTDPPNVSSDLDASELITDTGGNIGTSHTVGFLPSGQTYYIWGFVQTSDDVYYYTSNYVSVTTAGAPSVPIVTIDIDSFIENPENTANIQGQVQLTNGVVSEYGFVFGLTTLFSNGYNVTTDSYNEILQAYSAIFDGEIFQGQITLSTGTYYVRTYAINEVGTGYSDPITITINGIGGVLLPQVFTRPVVELTPGNFQLFGDLISMGEFGQLYFGYALRNIVDSVFTEKLVGSTELDPYFGTIYIEPQEKIKYNTSYWQDPLPNGTYQVYAFAYAVGKPNLRTNGNIVEFTVGAAFANINIEQPKDLIIDYTTNIPIFSLKTTQFSSPTLVFSRGFEWSTSASFSPSEVTTTLDIDTPTEFSATIPGQTNANLSLDTVYYVRAFADNVAGRAYSNVILIYTPGTFIVDNPIINVNIPDVQYNAKFFSSAEPTYILSKGHIWAENSQITLSDLNYDIGFTRYDVTGGNDTTGWSSNLLTTPQSGSTYFILPYVRLTSQFGNMYVYGSQKSVTYEFIGLQLYLDAGLGQSYVGSGNNWVDLSGYTRNGTIQNTTAVVYNSAGVASSLVFDGLVQNNSLVITQGYVGVSGNTSRSISIWVNPSSVASAEVLGWGVEQSYQMFDVLILNGEIGLHLFGTNLLSSAPITTGEWQNFIFTYDGDGKNIFTYKNGQFITKSPVPSSGIDTSSNNTLRIGNGIFAAGQSTGYGSFQGKLSIVRIWNKVLITEEVSSEYTSFYTRYLTSTVITGDATNVNNNSFTVANNSVSGTVEILERGVLYGLTSPPGQSIADPSPQYGAFSIQITGLQSNTNYFFQAYLKTANDSIKGVIKQQQTTSATSVPTVTLGTPTIGSTNISFSNNNVTDGGSSQVTARGVVWSTSENPLVNLSTKTTDGTGVGVFDSNATPLTKGVKYYFKAYATNSQGTGYSGEVFYFTLIEPTLTTNAFTFSNFGPITTTNGTVYLMTASASGVISDDGGSSITNYGVLYSQTANPNINTVGVVTINVTSAVSIFPFEFLRVMTNLSENTLYYYRVYAQNSVGYGYGNVISFTTLRRPNLNSLTVTPQFAGTVVLKANVSSNAFGNIDLYGVSYIAGFAYALSTGGTFIEVIADSSYTKSDSLLASPLNNFTTNVNLTTVGSWTIRTFVRTSIQEFSSDQVITVQTAPVVSLLSLDSGTTTSVLPKGELITTGGFTITERGFVYSLNQTPTISNSKNSETSSGFSAGTFGTGLTLTPLVTGNIYYIRAFVKTSTNVYYYSSEELSYETGGGIRLFFDSANTNSYNGSGDQIFDLSGAGNHGTVSTSGIVYEPSNNGAFRFAGTNPLSIITNFRGVTGSTPRSVSIWFNPSSAGFGIGGWGTRVSKQNFEFVMQNQYLGVHLWNSGYEAPSFIPLNEWTNVIFTYDGVSLKSYTNGNTNYNGIYTLSLNTGQTKYFKIGDDGYTQPPLKGLLSIFKIWDKVLSFTEIQTEYSTVVTRYNPPGVSTGVTSSITETSAIIINNEVYYTGTSPVSERGVVYSTTQNPTIANSRITVGSGTGSFDATITPLTAGTNYYVKAYARNASGTSYGKQIQLRTNLPFTISNFTLTNYFYTSQGTSALTGQLKISFDITGGVGLGLQAFAQFSSAIDGTKTTITTSPQTITSQIGIDFADTPGVSEIRIYDAIVLWNGTQYKMDSKSIQCENFYLNTGSSYNSSTNAFIGSIAFELRSGRVITEMGIAWKNKTTQPTGNVLDNPEQYTRTPATSATNFTTGGNYNFSISASSFANTQQITFRPYLIVDGYVMYAYAGETTLTKTAAVVVPTVTYTAPTTITGFEANPGGNVTSDGGASVTDRGIVWSSTVTTPAIGNGNNIILGNGTGVFTANLTGLSPNTTYYVRSYAINSAGTAYHSSSAATFTTAQVPEVNTGSIINLYSDQAQVANITITLNGAPAITQRGVVWSTTSGPTTALTTKTTDGSGITTFTTTIGTLNQNTLYYVKAYVTNSVDTYYGNELTFTTKQHPVIAGLSLSSVAYDLDTNGQVEYYNYSAGQLSPTETYVNSYQEFRLRITGSMSNLWSVGFVYSSSVSNINLLVKGASNTFYKESTTTSYKSREITGAKEILFGAYPVDAAVRPWYTRAYITDGTYITYSTTTREINIPKLIPQVVYLGDGTTDVKIEVRSMQPSTTPLPVINSGGVAIHPSNSGGTKTTGAVMTEFLDTPFQFSGGSYSMNIDIKTLIPNNGFYNTFGYVTYQSVDGPIRIYSLGFVTQKTNGLVTLNTTTTATSITSTGANSGGSWTWNGGTNITAYGVCWATTQNPTVANSKTNEGSSTATSLTFTSTITGLSDGVLYYVRSYATNTSGTSYGPQISFTTVPLNPPVVTTFAKPPDFRVDGQLQKIDFTATIGGISGSPNEVGVVWSTNTNPTLLNGVKRSITVSNNNNVTLPVALTNFTEMTPPSNIYYMRGFAKNSAGLVGYTSAISEIRLNYPNLISVQAVLVKNQSRIAVSYTAGGGAETLATVDLLVSTVPIYIFGQPASDYTVFTGLPITNQTPFATQAIYSVGLYIRLRATYNPITTQAYTIYSGQLQLQ